MNGSGAVVGASEQRICCELTLSLFTNPALHASLYAAENKPEDQSPSQPLLGGLRTTSLTPPYGIKPSNLAHTNFLSGSSFNVDRCEPHNFLDVLG